VDVDVELEVEDHGGSGVDDGDDLDHRDPTSSHPWTVTRDDLPVGPRASRRRAAYADAVPAYAALGREVSSRCRGGYVGSRSNVEVDQK
jgi:hypothetical protein